MALKVNDRVKETTSTTGTGTWNLDGLVTGFQTFVAGIGDGDTCPYFAINQSDPTEWETGIGTVTDAAPDTLARSVLTSSNGGALVNFTTAPTVACGFISDVPTMLEVMGVAAGANNYSHPNHTGDVTSSGDGVQTIAANAVTLAKMADMATASLLGRNTASTGDPEVLSAATARSILNVENGAAADQTNAQIKASYEANANTNEFSDAEQTNLGNQSGTNTGDEVSATTSIEGVVEKSTSAENKAGTAAGKYPDVAGVREIVGIAKQNSQSVNYTLVLTDAGKSIYHSSGAGADTFTIPANSSVAFTIGTMVTFVNDSGSGELTIAITTDTMRLSPDVTTGSRTLAVDGIATAIKVTATKWMISGSGLT